MKKLLLVLTILIFLTGCQSSSFTIERSFEENYYPDMTIDLESNTGDINIVNWDQEKVSIDAVITGRADTISKAENIARDTIINVNYTDNVLKVRDDTPDRITGINKSVSTSYYIKIPADFSAKLKINTGNINLEDVKGNLNIIGNTGDIKTGQLRGNNNIEINTGDVSLEEVYGDLSIEGNTGDISIGFLKGQADIDLNTGDFRGELHLLENRNNLIKTSTGDINISLVYANSIDLIAETNTGNLSIKDLDFDQSDLSNNRIEGNIGDASTKLEVITSTGSITISGK